MKIESVNDICQIQEQIEMEHKSRRNYPRKWSRFYDETPWKEMYNQDEINNQLELDMKDDSYIISPEMTKTLGAVCRCGRARKQLHFLKCLQNQQTKYLQGADEWKRNKLPETSSGFVGWQNQQSRYKQWENSMKYVSPMNDVPGQKLTATSYNAIIIG